MNKIHTTPSTKDKYPLSHPQPLTTYGKHNISTMVYKDRFNINIIFAHI